MGWECAQSPTLGVETGIFGIVNGKEAEGIYCNQNGANVSVNVSAIKSIPEIVQQRLFREFGQHAKIRILTVLERQLHWHFDYFGSLTCGCVRNLARNESMVLEVSVLTKLIFGA